MELLNAVNLIMPKLGERPVTSLSVKHPTLGILLPIITATRREILNRGWWFNEFDYKAFPSPAGEIAMGIDTLAFVPKYRNTAVLRGGRLYNPVTLSYVFTEPVEGRVRQDLEFEELPETAASFIFHSSLIDAYATDLGASPDLQIWQVMAGQAWSDLLGEHLRQKKFNTRHSRHWGRLVASMKG